MNQVRSRIANEVKRQGFSLAQYVDPTLRRHENVTIGENTVIFDHSSLHCQSTIGDNVFISSGVHIGHDCHIGNNVWINAGVCIGGGVTIKDNCFIGMNATISHGLTIEPNSFIGAATLVNKNTEQSQVVIAPAGESIGMNSETFLRFSKVMNHD
jgi:sugar O-acyltransferase (sialic acid O-acetyltransferase NeuD family)